MTQRSTIFGLAVLGDEVFTLGFANNTITVYDKATLKNKRKFNVEGMKFPGDIKTCPWHDEDCLFVIDWTRNDEGKKMYILDKDGNVKGQWTMENDFGRLSLTEKTPPTIVEVLHDQNKIAEFTIDGELIHKYPILPDQGVAGLQVAIKLNDGNVLASQGDPKDDLHLVCIVDQNGKKLKSFGSTKGGGVNKLNVPVYLAVDSKGTVIVADKFNNRILLLSSNLEFRGELIRFDESMFPLKMLQLSLN